MTCNCRLALTGVLLAGLLSWTTAAHADWCLQPKCPQMNDDWHFHGCYRVDAKNAYGGEGSTCAGIVLECWDHRDGTCNEVGELVTDDLEQCKAQAGKYGDFDTDYFAERCSDEVQGIVNQRKRQRAQEKRSERFDKLRQKYEGADSAQPTGAFDPVPVSGESIDPSGTAEPVQFRDSPASRPERSGSRPGKSGVIESGKFFQHLDELGRAARQAPAPARAVLEDVLTLAGGAGGEAPSRILGVPVADPDPHNSWAPPPSTSVGDRVRSETHWIANQEQDEWQKELGHRIGDATGRMVDALGDGLSGKDVDAMAVADEYAVRHLTPDWVQEKYEQYQEVSAVVRDWKARTEPYWSTAADAVHDAVSRFRSAMTFETDDDGLED